MNTHDCTYINSNMRTYQFKKHKDMWICTHTDEDTFFRIDAIIHPYSAIYVAPDRGQKPRNYRTENVSFYQGKFNEAKRTVISVVPQMDVQSMDWWDKLRLSLSGIKKRIRGTVVSRDEPNSNPWHVTINIAFCRVTKLSQ